MREYLQPLLRLSEELLELYYVIDFDVVSYNALITLIEYLQEKQLNA